MKQSLCALTGGPVMHYSKARWLLIVPRHLYTIICTTDESHAHTCTHAHMHTCTHTHTQAHMHTPMHTCTHHTHTCTHMHTHTRTHTHMHTPHMHTHNHETNRGIITELAYNMWLAALFSHTTDFNHLWVTTWLVI